MRRVPPSLWAFFVLFACIEACSDERASSPPAATNTAEEAAARADEIRRKTLTVDADRIVEANSEPGNWLAHGRTYSEQRFSPLDEINDRNVADLGLAWYFDTGTARGLEATPIVVDGVMFSSGSWSVVFANDAKTGELLWQFDPQVPREWGKYACCDVVNRGVAVWKGRSTSVRSTVASSRWMPAPASLCGSK
jgi:quinohemoprotein ethanol dehydrogenase